MTEVFFKCEQGLRENLEDAAKAVVVCPCLPGTDSLCVMVLCDGVGGAACGELASALATQQIAAWISAAYAGTGVSDLPALDADAILALQLQALEVANQSILREAGAAPGRYGMATTVVCAVIFSGRLHLAWLGDSRCYLYHQGSLERLTRDHSETQELVDAGVCTADEANLLPCAHVITRYLGQARSLEASSCVRTLSPGDLVLLCTDGLTDVVPDSGISKLVSEHLSGGQQLEGLITTLINRALQAGTQDNVSVMACHHQPPSQTKHAKADRTETGAYPVRRARALQRLHKENVCVHAPQFIQSK